MTADLSAIADTEKDPDLMPPVPSVWHDHGNGRCEEVPLVNREYLRKCGTKALYLVASEADLNGRFHVKTKEELIDLILDAGQNLPPPPPMEPVRKATAAIKRRNRSFKIQVRIALKQHRKLAA